MQNLKQTGLSQTGYDNIKKLLSIFLA